MSEQPETIDYPEKFDSINYIGQEQQSSKSVTVDAYLLVQLLAARKTCPDDAAAAQLQGLIDKLVARLDKALR